MVPGMRGRLGLGALVWLAVFVAAGCIGGPGTNAVLQVRNVSAQPIVVELDSPNNGILGWFPGTSRQKFRIDPWQAGWCPTTRTGVVPGTATVTVSGPQVQGTPSHAWTVNAGYTGTGETDLNVVVAADGSVQFDGPVPPDDGCQNYPFGPG
jgi:hypothetical protein